MSRVAKNPIQIPSGVDVVFNQPLVLVKGAKGSIEHILHTDVNMTINEGVIRFEPKNSGIAANALAGTSRALVNNMVLGVSTGFERKLTLVGVGYRAQIKGKVLNLTLGFSHPVNFDVPEGIKIETPSQTEVIISGVDKQAVGQVAAKIRSFRPPEPYKGKGVRYSDEHIVRKEAKKK
jgi:large subunit ribosomal protein L6